MIKNKEADINTELFEQEKQSGHLNPPDSLIAV